MKDKNLPNDYNSLSLEELTNEANKMIEDLENSVENYQNLLKLNNIIEKKFQKDIKNINEKTKEKIQKISSKKNDKKINEMNPIDAMKKFVVTMFNLFVSLLATLAIA